MLLVTLAAALAGLLAPSGAGAASLKPGQILVADGPGGDSLVLVNPATGKQSRFAANDLPVNSSSPLFESPSDVAIGRSGRIFVVDRGAFGGTGGVIAVDPTTGRQTKISANDQAVNATSQLFTTPAGIVVAPSGRILVVDRSAFGGPGGVIAVDPATGKQSVFSSNDQPVNASSQFFVDPRGGITVLRSGTVLVGNLGGTATGVIAIDPATGRQRDFSSNAQAVNASSQLYEIPVGVVESVTGRVFVADQNGPPSDPFNNGGVIAADPATGKQTAISSNSQPINSSSGFFSSPFDLRLGLNGRLFVLDASAFGDAGCGDNDGCGGLVSVNPATGKQSVLSSNAQAVNASDPLFHGISGLAVMPPRCLGKLATIYGTPAGERIKGTAGADVIAALGGKDRVAGLAGNDRICGGAGADLLRGGRGRDRLRGDGGRDGLFGGVGRDRLVGGKGRDLLRGGPGRDRQKQ
jgi:Ca2+-binding RTX toxin-like protein